MQVDNGTRVRLAVEAAQAIASRYGLATQRTRVLHDANNIVVHLAPSPVVAKLCASAGGGWQKLEREVAVARHLVQAGAPVVGPSAELPSGPHQSDGHAISFWRYYAPDGTAPWGEVAAETLAEVHRALAGYSTPLPSFLDRRVKRTGDALSDVNCARVLGCTDHAFLEREYASIMSGLQTRNLERRALHGDPHRGNFLAGSDGCVMIDFESVCSGPVEWDVSALPGEAAAVLAVDEELLAVMQRLRSLCVAVWCATRTSRSNEIAKAARLHLDLLKRAA